MANLILQNPAVHQRQQLFAALKWEPLFWLAVIAAGFAGVWIGKKVTLKKEPQSQPAQANSNLNMYLSAIIAVVGSVLIAQFCIGMFAQNIRMFDSKLGFVIAQPAVGQIALAVFAAFGVAGFVFKKFLDVSYIWPSAAAGFITAFAISIYAKQDVLEHLVQRWPAVFFSNTILAISPIQMAAFGTLGAVAGYWQAVRYCHWRKHN